MVKQQKCIAAVKYVWNGFSQNSYQTAIRLIFLKMIAKFRLKTDHFKPLWSKNVPKFGIAHAMALGLGPWLAVEIPDLVSKGLIQPV